MLEAGRALTGVATDDLKALLRVVHRGELACPVTAKSLAEVGLLRLGDELDFLKGLDRAAVQAVLVAVLAERPT